MELQKIEQLVERYFEGKTTLTEERQLHDYFKQDNVAAHLDVYRPMFQHFSASKEESMPKDKAVPTVKPMRNYKWFAVAATVAIVLGMTFFVNQNSSFSNSEQEKAYAAYLETKEALQMTSKIFNRGAEQLAHIEEFEISKNKVFK